MNLLDYLATEFAPFDEKPFDPVDSAVLSQFCMVRAEGVVPALRERYVVPRPGHHRGEPAVARALGRALRRRPGAPSCTPPCSPA